MAGFVVRHLEHDGTEISVVRPENLQFSLRKKEIHTVQYEVSHATGLIDHDAGYPFASSVGALRTDFELLEDTTVIMAGVHHPAPVVAQNEDHTAVFGKDWKYYLSRRHYPFVPGAGVTVDADITRTAHFAVGGTAPGYAFEYSNTDVTVIIKKLLDVTLARPNSLAITYPTLTTALGIPTDFSLALGDTRDILSFIEGFSDIDPGFDYEILPTKELRLYSPHKYDPAVWDDPLAADYVFDSTTDAIVEGPSFSNNGPNATHWLGQGSGIGIAKVGVELGSIDSAALYRRWDGFADYGANQTRKTITDRAKRDFKWALNPQHEIEMTVIANRIENFWTLFEPGVAIWVDKELISQQIQSAQEIVSMECSVDTEGNCFVNLGLNQIFDPTTAGIIDYDLTS